MLLPMDTPYGNATHGRYRRQWLGRAKIGSKFKARARSSAAPASGLGRRPGPADVSLKPTSQRTYNLAGYRVGDGVSLRRVQPHSGTTGASCQSDANCTASTPPLSDVKNAVKSNFTEHCPLVLEKPS
jgi:hypothetical protein